MSNGGAHYFPRPDGPFDSWAANYGQQLHAWWEQQGLDPKDLEDFDQALSAWQAAWPAHVTAQAAAAAARAVKDDARAALVAALRPHTRFVQSYPNTTDADRAALGITIPKQTRTPSPIPATRPTATIISGNRLTHELLLVDESTPTSRAQPKGVRGAEVWTAVVPPGAPVPTDPAAFTYAGLATTSTLRRTYPAKDGGSTAAYLLRWVSTRDQPGPWSDPVVGTVAA